MSNPWDESPIVSSANESEPWLSSPIVSSAGKPEQSDTMAGLKTAFKQLPELGWGLGAIAAAGIESMAGEGGIATAAKKFSVSKMQDWQSSIAKDSRDVYDLDVAWDKAKSGDFGALVNWAQYGVGYAIGQGIQILGTAGAGKLITQAAIKPSVEKLASGMVAKEAAKIGASEAGKAMAEDQITKMAVANVAGKLGEQVALAGVAFGMEGGEIGGDLAERSVKENRSLTGSELARGLGATLLAGSMEYGGDLISLGAMKGFKGGKLPFDSTPGIAGKVGRAAVSTAMTAPVEGATEYFQTGAEEYGKGTEENILPFNQSAENQRQALNAAGLGAIGGGAHAVLGAAISKPAPKPSDVLEAQDVDSAIAAADAAISAPLALPSYAGEPLVTFPDGTTMTRAEYEQRRLDGMVQQVEQPEAEKLGLPHYSGPTLVVGKDGSTMTGAEAELRRQELEQQRLDGMVQPVEAEPTKPLALPAPAPIIAAEDGKVGSAGQLQNEELAKRIKAIEDQNNGLTADVIAAQEARNRTEGLILKGQKVTDMSDNDLASYSTSPRVAMSVRNVLKQEIERRLQAPSVETPATPATAGVSVSEPAIAQEPPAKPEATAPVQKQEATTPNSESVVAQNNADSAKSVGQKASPIMQRKDIVGAIMRVTGGKGISVELAQTLGDKANNATKLRGLFSNAGVSDLSDIAERLRDDEGFDVKDASHLEELVREAAAGNLILSLQDQQQEMEVNQEKQHRKEIYRQADDLGVKRVARKFSEVEAEVLKILSQRQQKAEEEAGVRFAEAMREAESVLTQDEIDAVADTMSTGGSAIEYYNEFWNKLKEAINGKESARRSQDGGVSGQEAGTQSHAEPSREEEFALTGQTEDEARAEAKRLEKPEAETTKEQIDREATAPFSLAQESQPSRDSVTGGQGGLFTPDSRVSKQETSEHPTVSEEKSSSEFSSLEKELAQKSHAVEAKGDIGVVVGGGKVRFVSMADAVDAARRAIESGTKAVPFQIHNATGIRLGDTNSVLSEINQGINEVSKAKEALDTAGITGKDRLDTIAAVRRGELTAEDVSEAHTKESAEEQPVSQEKNTIQTKENDSGVAMFSRSGQQEMKPVDTNSPEFKRWFGDSKVVDAEGKPLVVYHGTTARNITEFLPSGGREGEWKNSLEHFKNAQSKNDRYGYMNFRSGSFFSPKSEYAGHYTGENTGVMYPVYIRAENPIYFDQKTGVATGVDPNKTPDALILHEGGEINEIAVIDPTQIKSAISNTGEFDPANPNIQFSRLTQTDERTGRMVHMEDLEAVAQKFRQSFPGLPVHALENERQAPKSLRAEISNMGATGDIGGAFHEGQVYLFRSGLFGLEHAEEVAVHEATHGGLSRFFGDSIGPVMMDIHRSNAKVTDQALTLKKKYGYSTVRATEEVLADMGPTVTKLKGWDRLVAWVRDKLRKFGLVKEWSDNDVQALVLRALEAVKNPKGSHIYRGTAFSVSLNGFRDAVKKVIEDVSNGKRVQSEPIHVLDSTPSTMQVFGWSDMPVAIKPSEIDKIHFDHGVTAEKISSLVPETLKNPAAILASASHQGRLVFVSDEEGSKPMLLVVSPESDTKVGKRQLIVSMYPKDEGWSWVGRQIRNGLLMYRDPEASVAKNFSASVLEAQKKISQTGRPMTGLIPEIGAKQLGDGYKVLLPSDLRKWETQYAEQDLSSERIGNQEASGEQAQEYGQVQTETSDGPVRFSRSTQTPAQAGVSTSGEIIGDSNRDYTPEQRRAFGNTGRIVQHQTLKERAAAIWKDAGKKMAQGIVDQFAPVKDLSEKAYTLLRLSKGATGAFEAFMEHGKLSIRDGAYDADTSGGVMNKVFYPIGKESTDFLYWVAGNRAERLKAEGKENLFTDEDIAAYKSLADGVTDFDYTMANGQVTRDRTKIYADTLKKFNEFNKNVLDISEQSGLIDGESRHLWENEFYVPFYRTAPEDDGGVRGMNIKQGVIRQEAFKKLKGGTDGLNDLLSNTLMNWAHLIDAAAKNRAAEATLKAAETAGVARKSVSGEKKTVWHMGKITKEIPAGQEYEENGVTKVSDGTAKITYTGKIEYKVEDPYLLAALNGLEYAGLRGPAMDALSATKHWLTIGVTASPFFKVRNLIRDSIQAIGTAELGYNPLDNVKQGWKLTDRESQEYVSALAGGGLIRFGTMLEGNESARTRQLIKKGNPEASILDSESKVRAFYDRHLEPALTAYNEIGNRGEEINRMALYDQLIKQGKDHATASLLARDLMDFSMQGAWTSIRFLTQVVPFMNARLQGLYKLGKSAKEDPQRFATVLGAVTLASLTLLAMFHDDDDWKKREDWDRDNYWWFKFGGMAFRIPKPFEIGAIATLAERSAELAFDNEMTGKRFRDRLLAITSDQLSMNPIPQMVKPIMDVYANKDSFRGSPIETMGMDKLAPDYRFKQSTSMVARGISTAGQNVTQLVGQNFLSPVQVDHLIQGYFSWLGAFVVGGADMAIRSVSDQPTKPTIDYWKTATGGMASQLDGASSRYVSQMYEQAKELEQAYGTWRHLVKEGKGAEAQEYRLDHAEELSKYRQVERVKKAEARINERMRMIERSNLDADTKRERINELRKQQDQVARVLSV